MIIYVYVTAVTRLPLEPPTLTRVPLGLVTLHHDYSPMLFRQLRHDQKVVNISVAFYL